MRDSNRAALYCRLSREDREKEGESESIQNQKKLLTEYALERGWEIWDVYCDEDYSGIDRARPAFSRLLKDAGAGLFEIVLVKTQSRFTRDMEMVEKYIHGLFPLWGIRFVAVVDNADTAIRGNKKARQINGLVNEWYLEDLSENIRAVFDVKRRDGQYIGSFPVYGYQKDPLDHNRLVIDLPAAETVRAIYRMCLSGMGKQRIAAELNSLGIPNPTLYKQRQGLRYTNGAQKANDGLWNRTTVGRLLRCPLYTGDMVQGVRRKASYKSKRLLTVPPEEWVVVPDTHEAIIDRATYAAVERMLKERTRAGGTGEVHALAGKVRCLDCGAAMAKYSNTYRGKRRAYLRCKRCAQGLCTSHAIRLDLLEERVAALLRGHLARCDGEALAKGVCRTPAGRDTAVEKEVTRIQGEISRRDKASRTLYLDKSEGLISGAQFSELYTAYQNEITVLRARLAQLEKQRSSKEPPVDVSGFLKFDALPRSLAVLAVKLVEVGQRDPDSGRQVVRITWNF